MGYKHDGYQLSLRYYARSEAIGAWLESELVERVLFDPLAIDGTLRHCTHLAEDLGDPKAIGSADELHAKARGWGYGTFEMMAGADPADTEWYLQLTVEPSELRVFLGLGASIVRASAASLLAQLDRWVVSWTTSLPLSLELGKGSFAPTQDDYPRAMPLRQSLAWPLGALVQYVGIRFHRSDAERSAVLDRLIAEPLPATASRRTDGDLLILSFIDDLGHAETIRRARAAQERWMIRLVETEPARGWNEHGDRLVGPINAVPLDPLTLWEPSNNVGYKAIVVDPDGSVDEPVWNAMVEIARSGRLADGTVVKALRLVAPRREDAMAILDRALDAGFEMVVYPQGRAFWQVRPSRAPTR